MESDFSAPNKVVCTTSKQHLVWITLSGTFYWFPFAYVFYKIKCSRFSLEYVGEEGQNINETFNW